MISEQKLLPAKPDGKLEMVCRAANRPFAAS
jgi:hypothetical protein